MKSQVLENIENLQFKEVPRPEPSSREMLMKVQACAICGTDIKIYHHGHRLITFPRITGHEVAGELVEVGEEVEGFAPGDRVAVAPAVPCRRCYYCQRGEEAMCENLRAVGYYWDGGFAEYMLIPREVISGGCVNKIPEGLSFEVAALAEPFACAINAQELMWVSEGDVVVVIGSGPLGCIHSRLARIKGADKVIILEVSAHRLEMAKEKARADFYFNPAEDNVVDKIKAITGGRGADRVIVACGSDKAQSLALELVAPLGSVNFFGGLPKDKPLATLNTNFLHYKECYAVGTHGSSPQHNRLALEVLGSGLLDVEDLITHRLPLKELKTGLGIAEKGEGLKVIIEP